MHKNYGVTFDQASAAQQNSSQPNSSQDKKEKQIKKNIDEGKGYAVELSEAGEHPNFARFLKDADE